MHFNFIKGSRKKIILNDSIETDISKNENIESQVLPNDDENIASQVPSSSPNHTMRSINSDLQTKLWKAHEAGIAVTPVSSLNSLKKTILRRSQSTSSFKRQYLSYDNIMTSVHRKRSSFNAHSRSSFSLKRADNFSSSMHEPVRGPRIFDSSMREESRDEEPHIEEICSDDIIELIIENSDRERCDDDEVRQINEDVDNLDLSSRGKRLRRAKSESFISKRDGCEDCNLLSINSSIPPIEKAHQLRKTHSILSSVSLLSELEKNNPVTIKSSSDDLSLSYECISIEEEEDDTNTKIEVTDYFPPLVDDRILNSQLQKVTNITLSFDNKNGSQDIFRDMDDNLRKKKSHRRSFSDVHSAFFLAQKSNKDDVSTFQEPKHTDDFHIGHHYDTWEVLEPSTQIQPNLLLAYRPPFRILGTNTEDVKALPHVLSPPLMESLQNFLPVALSEDNFWIKYSMIRDGASLYTMLKNINGSDRTIIAIETTNGEVFGSFTSSYWRKGSHYFGTGEAFLWRMRRTRNDPWCESIIDQAILESELDVYPWTGENNFVQLLLHDRIAVGGGGSGGEMGAFDEYSDSDSVIEGGFGLTFDEHLQVGESGPCPTFGNPSLCQFGEDGIFQIANLEVWTLTPCWGEKEAENMEFGKRFIEDNRRDK